MSWIKDHKFVLGLTGGTLVGAVALYFVGSKGMERYQSAKDQYQTAAAEVESYKKINPYPSSNSRDAKQKAVDEYRQSLQALQASFDAYRVKELKNVSPQDFTNHLKSASDEVRKACKDSGTKLPDAFFCGFEGYKDGVAKGNATGILEYQLDGVKEVLLALSKSGASELKNLHRPPLVEETGEDKGEYKAADGDIARALPLEMVFVAPEKSAREFLSALGRLDGKFVVIRTIRIASTKKDPPRTSDAKFAAPTKPVAAAAADDPFAGGFQLPAEGGAAPTPAEPPKPAPKPVDSGRVLSQVLGSEEVQVFVRLDFLRFLPTQKLP